MEESQTGAEPGVEPGLAPGVGAESERRRRRGARRRENVAGGRHHAHKVKVSPEEEAVLLQLAGAHGVTVPRLLLEAALAQHSDQAGETASERRELLTELFRIERLLGSVANNVNQIARATNSTGEWQPETMATFEAVHRLASRIDEALDRLALRSGAGSGLGSGVG